MFWLMTGGHMIRTKPSRIEDNYGSQQSVLRLAFIIVKRHEQLVRIYVTDMIVIRLNVKVKNGTSIFCSRSETPIMFIYKLGLVMKIDPSLIKKMKINQDFFFHLFVAI